MTGKVYIVFYQQPDLGERVILQGVYTSKVVAVERARTAATTMRAFTSRESGAGEGRWCYFVVEQVLDIPGMGERVFGVDSQGQETTEFPWSVTSVLLGQQKLHME